MNIEPTSILYRVRIYLKLKNDTSLARYLGVSTATISKWKTRDSIDFNLLNKKLPETADLNWLYRGLLEEDYLYNYLIEEVGEWASDRKNLLEKLELYVNQIWDLNEENNKLKSNIEILQDTFLKIQSNQTCNEVRKLSNQGSVFVTD